jgi:hypothetical protein
MACGQRGAELRPDLNGAEEYTKAGVGLPPCTEIRAILPNVSLRQFPLAT